MRKLILTILISLLIFSFTLAQTTQIDIDKIRQIIESLQNLTRTSTPSLTSPTQPIIVTPRSCQPRPACLDAIPPCLLPEPIEGWCPSGNSSSVFVPPEKRFVLLPKGISPAVPLEKPITPEVIKRILPDEDRGDDIIVQLNNLRITRIATSVPDARAIFFAVRDIGWKCLRFETEDALTGIPCLMNLRKPIAWRELAIKITDDTILLQRNRQRAKLEDFQVGDKINVYGFMDKDNYGIEGLIVRRLTSKSTTTIRKPPEFIGPPICAQVITPAYDPQNPSICREFPTPCDVPSGWVKTDRCPVSIKGCKVGGCNSELCGEEGEDLFSPCVLVPAHDCYKKAKCERQPDGKCGWTMTPEAIACFESLR